MIMGRKDEIRRRIEILNAELERLESLPDFDRLEDGSVLAVAVRHQGGRASQYVGLKEAGRWSFTGRNTPAGANGDQVAEWLTRAGRQVIVIEVIATLELVRVPAVDLGALLDSLTDRRRATERGLSFDDAYEVGR